MVSKENVQRLVDAAWRGMAEELALKPGSADDVINAALNVARNAILYSCGMGETSKTKAHNRRVMRNFLQQLLLETVDADDAGKVQ